MVVAVVAVIVITVTIKLKVLPKHLSLLVIYGTLSLFFFFNGKEDI